MTQIKCIGFDLYSTLINIDNHNRNEMMEPVYSIIQNLGYTEPFESFMKISEQIYWKWRDYRERTQKELKSEIWWKELLEQLHLNYPEEAISQIILASHEVWRTQISLYPRVKELLTDLKRNYKIVCISNISEGDLARGDMEMFDILDIFDLVVMSSDFNIRKPSPKIFEYVLNQLKIKRNEMIFVGDTLYDDVQGAKAAGLLMAIHIKRDRSYFFPEYAIKPDKTIKQLREIIEILKIRNKKED